VCSAISTKNAPAWRLLIHSWGSYSSRTNHLPYRILTNFQEDFSLLVERSNNGEIELFCALTNSNLKFISCLKEFVEKVRLQTAIKQASIEKSLSYQKLMKTFAEISNRTFLGIQDVVKNLIAEKFTATIDHSKFAFVD
jgi:hypothetical protein